MKHLLLILLLTVLSGLGVQAQQKHTFTRQLQERVAGQGTVILIQDEEIAALVDNVPVDKSAAARSTAVSPTKQSSQGASRVVKPVSKPAAVHNARSTSAPAAPSVDPKKPVAPTGSSSYTGRRARHKVQGYRVQVFSGSGNAQAKKAAKAIEAKIRHAFPELAVYCHFKSPRWICRAGDFATRADAQRYLTKILNLKITSEASIVSDQVFVVN